MRYATPIILLKYLQYYLKGANSKGHGIHSPFVYKFIREDLNAIKSSEELMMHDPALKQRLAEINSVLSRQLPEKIKRLIVVMMDKWKPASFYVSGEVSGSNKTMEGTTDFIFLGASNSKDSVLTKAVKLIDSMHPHSLMILEGIHSSSVMEEAWEGVKKNPKSRLTIDLFFIGIIFCRTEQKEQEHFIIRY
jgi:hypothetical protein